MEEEERGKTEEINEVGEEGWRKRDKVGKREGNERRKK